MSTVTYTRQTILSNSLEQVTGFLAETQNLPRWTGFFLSVKKPIDGGSAHMQTRLGPCVTRIDVDEGFQSRVLTITSAFPTKRESATVRLKQAADMVVMNFDLSIPDSVEPTKRDAMLHHLELELKGLQQLLGERESMVLEPFSKEVEARNA